MRKVVENVIRPINEVNHIQTTVRHGQKIKSEIVFGSPGMGCEGSGICKVVPASMNSQSWKCPHAQAWVSLVEGNIIRFSFIKSSMDARMVRRYFRWQLFQIFEPYRLPPSLEKRLKSAHPLIISPGIYRVYETDRTMVVDFVC